MIEKHKSLFLQERIKEKERRIKKIRDFELITSVLFYAFTPFSLMVCFFSIFSFRNGLIGQETMTIISFLFMIATAVAIVPHCFSWMLKIYVEGKLIKEREKLLEIYNKIPRLGDEDW